VDLEMAGHQDARYIPQIRERDRSPPRRDRFPVRRLTLTAVVMIVVVLALFLLFYRRV